ncbi:MAG: hypothetical protein CTY34_07060 [Methylobacter sp.]|nr:MAG: hypothetical protein CTY34_07060 [Methylobacter sp.]
MPKSLTMENTAQDIFSRIDASNLPVLPRVLLDLLTALKQPDTGLKELTNIISQDASLSAKILSVANSSFYRQFGGFTDLNRVINVLGLNTVKTIAITRSVQQFFSEFTQHQQPVLEIIWFKSLTCAHLAKKIAELTSYPSTDEAYLTGLLHRIGQLALLESFSESYSAVFFQELGIVSESATSDRLSWDIDHAEVGGLLADSWHLHSFIADAIRYQNATSQFVQSSASLVKLINLASLLGNPAPDNWHFVLEQANQLYGFNQSVIEDIVEQTAKQVEQSIAQLDMDFTDIADILNPEQTHRRQKINQALGGSLKEIMLASVINGHMLDSAPALSKWASTLKEALSVLFGFHASAVFIYQEQNRCLQGLSGEYEWQALWSTISIQTDSNLSLLAKTFNTQRMLHSFNSNKNEPDTLVDRQICKLLNSEGMLVVPILLENRVLAVLTIGTSAKDALLFKSKAGLLKLFANEAARSMQRLLFHAQEQTSLKDSIEASYQLHAKKLIHEINNPLTIISNYLYLLSIRLGKNGADELNIIQSEIERVSQIVMRLSDMPETSDSDEKDRINVNSVIQDLSQIFQLGILKNLAITCTLELDPQLPVVRNHTGKFKQVLTNLIKNAAEAMPQGGSIKISSNSQFYLGKQCYVEIVIADTGPGLPQHVLDHLFTPVSSTKGLHNSGLGLAICKNLMDEMEGLISCNSSLSGTTFRILPRDDINHE